MPEVKLLVDGIMNGAGRPRKLSFAMIERTLNLPQKQIYKLPRCAEYIEQHLESQGEYWAREVGWAIAEIKKEALPLNCRRILKLTNMRRNDLAFCSAYIKDAKPKEELRILLDQEV